MGCAVYTATTLHRLKCTCSVPPAVYKSIYNVQCTLQNAVYTACTLQREAEEEGEEDGEDVSVPSDHNNCSTQGHEMRYGEASGYRLGQGYKSS